MKKNFRKYSSRSQSMLKSRQDLKLQRLFLNDLLGKECFSTRPLDWTVTAGMEWKWRSSITKYVEAFLELGIPRFPKVG